MLLLPGEFDYITDEDVAFYARVRPGTETAVIPNAGHLTFLDNPEASIAAIPKFTSTQVPEQGGRLGALKRWSPISRCRTFLLALGRA